MKRINNNLSQNDHNRRPYLDVFMHKLKNPLHSIGINLEVVKNKINKLPGKNSQDIQKHLNIIGDELSNIGKIANCFSEFFHPTELKRTQISVEQLITSAVNELKMQCPNGEIITNFKNDSNNLKIFANKDDCLKALTELLTNAVEATPVGKKIEIGAEKTDDYIKIIISDQGEGIAKNRLYRIWDLFYSKKRAHSGCGMPLAKKKLEENGGNINLTSHVKQGTTISIIFKSAGKKL